MIVRTIYSLTRTLQFSLVIGISLLMTVFIGRVAEAQVYGTYTDLHDFGGTITDTGGTNGPDGFYPVYSGVTFDSTGDMYGTAAFGGNNGDGMVWEITAAGNYVDLHDFGGTATNVGGTNVPDGKNPIAGVTVDTSGNLYGTTSNGGLNQVGIVWEITTAGSYEVLHAFGGNVTNSAGTNEADGSAPQAGVTIDGTGDLYGTATEGGASSDGIVWEITSGGTYTDLHDFGGELINVLGTTAPDGVYPIAGVTLDSAGDIYGTTEDGGGDAVLGSLDNAGMVWEITSTGTYEDLHDFGATITDSNGVAGPDGNTPRGGVSFDKTGNMSGTTAGGGAVGGGIVWEITTSGVYEDLHDFNYAGTVETETGAEGMWPQAGITFDSAGNMYGTTQNGGIYTSGSSGGIVWELTTGKSYRDLHDFAGTTLNADGAIGPDGIGPNAGVAFDSAGNLYGSTSFGGEFGTTPGAATAGMLYKLTLGAGTVPSAPTNLTATGGNAQVILTWSASTGETTYNVYRGTSSGNESVTPVATEITSTTYTDTSVTNGTTYYYTVSAVNASGTSAMSNEASATPQIAGPTAPTGLTATPGDTQVTLSWTANNSAMTYDVYRGTSAGGESATPIEAQVGPTKYTDTGLTNGTTYYYKVSSVNPVGTSALSNEASATPELVAPTAPTGLTATAGNALVVLSWTASFGETTYNVYRGTSTGGETATPIAASLTVTSYTDTAVTNGTTYFYTVAAVNAAGTSVPSNEASATPQVPPPAPPTGLTATPGNGSVVLSWTAGAGAVSYNVYRGTSPGAESPTPTATGITPTAYTDTGLSNGATYYYEVSSVNPGGTSANSNEATATPDGPDSLPQGVSFFSSPYDYPDSSVDDVFGAAGVTLYVWDPSTLLYDETPAALAKNIRLGVGYWVKSAVPTTFSAIGTPASTTQPFSILLSAGWNQIGDPFTTPVQLTTTTFVTLSQTLTWTQATTGPAPVIRPSVWGYAAGTGYVATTTLSPYQGYFIFADTSALMVIPPP